jgi:hypothetical protein
LPERSKKNVGIVWIKSDVDAAGVLIFIENLLPVLAAVDRAENTTLGIGPVGMP